MRLRRHFYLSKLISKIQERMNVIDRFDGLKLKQIDYIVFTNQLINRIKNELDFDYHENINDEQFKKWGHIYYNKDGKVEGREK